jgi:hypothetical protein
MGSTTLLTILRDFLVVLGALAFLWGIYDMFGDGQQSSMGVKKIIGGIAFASIAYFVMTSSIKNISAAEAQAGITGCVHIPFIINNFLTGLIR